MPPDRMFEAKPVWKRMVVILAGVTMNALFAWFVFTFLAAKNGRQIDPTTTVGRVIEELVPPGGGGAARHSPGLADRAHQRPAGDLVGRRRAKGSRTRRSRRCGSSWTAAAP